MQKGIVRIADGSPETRARLSNFKSKMQLEKPLEKITMGDAIDYAIIQAEKVHELKKKIKELQGEVDTLNSATSDMARELQENREY